MTVMIVGGGMAGATLALAISTLSQGKVPVDLIEAISPLERQHQGFDGRAIALTEGTSEQLETISIWQRLAGCATAITDIHVSDRGHACFVNLKAADYRVPSLGHVVELHEAGQRLFSLLQQAPGVRLHCPAQVVDVARTSDKAMLTLDNGTVLTGQLMVAADGSNSMLAASCGIQWQQRDYEQIAVIANVTTSEPHRGRAFERFTAQGPLAMLPMSKGRSSLVWCHANSQQAQVDSWHEDEFRQQLQQAFGWRLGAIVHIGERHSYPLRLLTASQHISHRLALVGNAAQTLHPIAGQGFNLGLRDVMSLAETVVDAMRHHQDPGCYRVLSRYQQRRQSDQQTTVALTDGLVRLFANRYTALEIGRNLGLMAMNNLPLMRDALARRTLGWVER
ncbi:2-octaprenyl-6-methoxyphenol hydroxylase|uniref:2-octaprenyl-6-methoxyphenol hydroxylase /2-octaprenyl-3-methyl-6-methoxy-1,4-benzoquinol hydroxylase n=1 Tax=Brenneria salicis ATCC 15712 = DSM 30166 TaxID=714314 RepID=A0A366I2U9_9GAMM|nr:2-octaprenyl-6-methoxyphenyl hydroxylase [Brenneria salicis]NMN92990.1 2-octaprenyl-6-methoxyphenol hydroxylase [Brenneria salicis ATCC 15712 = DSM 30166]RBP61963.1 2-octaprenyl-6-methoxyphenol hydroxylase /2-octaprenyl-3-methyl-6-methoxy-1,4-benzoquinol hydroxylase [Brenneria salicis ATCC 15712 = DSM 30166]RLM31233.1 2-octaprenyl-6-methoxyphenyl hydroxylase [Brenneria salicis ATCC 15712 = DSM 30166]